MIKMYARIVSVKVTDCDNCKRKSSYPVIAVDEDDFQVLIADDNNEPFWLDDFIFDKVDYGNVPNTV